MGARIGGDAVAGRKVPAMTTTMPVSANPETFPKFLIEMYRAIDAMDAAGFGACFEADGEFAYANLAPVVGPAGVEAFTNQFYTAIDGISHALKRAWEGDDGRTLLGEGVATYTRKDGSRVSIAFFSVSEFGATNRLKSYRVYIDVAPLFAQ